MDDFMPLVSVVVPVYNSEKYLEKCVDSILTQKYTNFELILVNDGSKDKSGEICDDYEQKDLRVVVYHKDNGGASSARNLGIDNANGDYIVFVDSDDYVDDKYLSAFFVEELKYDKYTFVIQDLKLLYYGVEAKQPPFRKGLYTKDTLSEFFSTKGLVTIGGPYCKLYRKQVLNNYSIRFNTDIHHCEDLLFMLTYMSYIENLFLSSETHYNYISTDGSLSKSYNTYESEILTFYSLGKVFTKLVELFQLDNKAKDNFNINTLGVLLQRAMLTIYRPTTKKNRRERISILKELYTYDNVGCLEKYTQNGIIVNKIGFNLYKKKLFGLFDLYYLAVYSLRYKLNNQWQKFLKRKNINKYSKIS